MDDNKKTFSGIQNRISGLMEPYFTCQEETIMHDERLSQAGWEKGALRKIVVHSNQSGHRLGDKWHSWTWDHGTPRGMLYAIQNHIIEKIEAHYDNSEN